MPTVKEFIKSLSFKSKQEETLASIANYISQMEQLCQVGRGRLYHAEIAQIALYLKITECLYKLYKEDYSFYKKEMEQLSPAMTGLIELRRNDPISKSIIKKLNRAFAVRACQLTVGLKNKAENRVMDNSPLIFSKQLRNKKCRVVVSAQDENVKYANALIELAEKNVVEYYLPNKRLHY